MFQPKDKKITIDYQPNRHLIIEYGNYEEHKNYAWIEKHLRLSVVYIPFGIIILLGLWLTSIDWILLGVLIILTFYLFHFVVLQPFISSLIGYYKLEITHKGIKEFGLIKVEFYKFTERIEFKVEKTENQKELFFLFDDNEYIDGKFVYGFSEEINMSEKVLNSLIELLNLELIDSKNLELERKAIFTYQSRN
jgi:hypothetical protein